MKDTGLSPSSFDDHEELDGRHRLVLQAMKNKWIYCCVVTIHALKRVSYVNNRPPTDKVYTHEGSSIPTRT